MPTGARAAQRETGTSGGAGGKPASPAGAGKDGAVNVSHNLAGQKLGRKGRHTRERILAATVELLALEDQPPISLSAVARSASLGMTSLYNYFTDLTELLLAVLEPVMATADDGYLAMLRERWPDETLGESCLAFMVTYHGFWSSHARLLHLRNSMADNGDLRMRMHRVRASMPIIGLLVQQMDCDPDTVHPKVTGMGTVLVTGLERVVTVATDPELVGLFGDERRNPPEYYLNPEARILELAIRDIRDRAARKARGES